MGLSTRRLDPLDCSTLLTRPLVNSSGLFFIGRPDRLLRR